MSIHDVWSKIKGAASKSSLDRFTLIYLVIIVLVGLSSFGLGRLSSTSSREDDSGINITNVKDFSTAQSSKSEISDPVSAKVSPPTNTKGNYVASKHGKLYYTSTCKGAKRIKSENEVWFETASDAEMSGYAPSPSCK